MDVSQQRVNADKHGWPEFLNWRRVLLPAHEPSFGARPVPGRSGSGSLLVPEPSPSRRLHSDPLRAGTSRAPDAGGFRGARRDKSSGHSLLGGEGKGEGGPPTQANHLAFWTQVAKMAANRFMTIFRKTTFPTEKPPALPE